MKLDFTGKVVLITGGTSGIGLAAARMFLAAGAFVTVMGRNLEKGQATVRELATIEKSPLFLCGDVTNVYECERVVRDTCSQFGRLDVLVNSAGEYLEKPIDDMSEEDFDRILSVNIKGSYFMSKAAVPELKRNRGTIVNVSSDAGVNGNINCTAYCAAKGAVTLFTKALALDCEMVGVGPKGEESIAARVSIVNQYGKCVYDKYVKPTEPVTDRSPLA